MSHVKQVTADLKAIPRERRVQKYLRSAFGLVFIAGAVVAAWELQWPWYVVLPIAIFGAHIVSAELVRAAAQFVVAMVKDLLAAVRSKEG